MEERNKAKCLISNSLHLFLAKKMQFVQHLHLYIFFNQKYKMKVILLVLVLVTNYSFAQSSKIDSLVSIIVNANVVSGYTKGINGIISEEYQAYKDLIMICEIEELITLCKHQNACVRCYAFLALSNKKRTLAEEILLKNGIDNEQVTLINGCFGQRITVSDFMKSRGREIENPYSFKF